MTAQDLPDFDDLARRLVQLRHREKDLGRVLLKAEERCAQFPTPFAQKTLDDLLAEDAALRSEIGRLEEELRPVLRRLEPS